jgi:PAS domain-containing protein
VFAGEAVTIKDQSVALRGLGGEGMAERNFTAWFSPIRDETGRGGGHLTPPSPRQPSVLLAERRLRQSEERFRAIVETATDYAIFTIDPQGLITTWPRGAQEVFGWSADEAVGQPVDMTFTPEDRAIVRPRRSASPPGPQGRPRCALALCARTARECSSKA